MKPFYNKERESMNYFLVLSLVVTFVTSVFAQQGQEETTRPIGIVQPQDMVVQLNRELREQKLIRIVEPIIYPLLRLARSNADWVELRISCGLSGVHDVSIKTENGQVWVNCVGTPEFLVYYHGPNTPEQVYGDRVIDVVVQGFATKERLCVPYNLDVTRKLGTYSDLRMRCKEGESIFGLNGEMVRADIVARLTIKTKLVRWGQKEAEAETNAIRQLNPDINPSELRVVKAGDIKSRSIEVSPVVYEFIK